MIKNTVTKNTVIKNKVIKAVIKNQAAKRPLSQLAIAPMLFNIPAKQLRSIAYDSSYLL